MKLHRLGDNPDANVYSIVDQIKANKAVYLHNDGTYHFRLTYGNSNGKTDILEWKQTSFPGDNNGIITGYKGINIASEADVINSCNIIQWIGFIK